MQGYSKTTRKALTWPFLLLQPPMRCALPLLAAALVLAAPVLAKGAHIAASSLNACLERV